MWYIPTINEIMFPFLYTGYTLHVGGNHATAKRTFLKLPVVDKKVHTMTLTLAKALLSPLK